MKSLLALAVLSFALAFCGLGDKIKQLSGGSANSPANSNSPANGPKSPTGGDTAEKATPTSEQQAIADAGDKTSWDDQGMSWMLPKGWKKMTATKAAFNYSSPDLAFLLVNISDMPSNFPAETSLKATYESSVDQIRTGKYEKVRYLEIDGIKGVEFVETMPEDKGDPRRHQWIAYRTYQGNNQMLNVMLSTKGSNFEKHTTDFPAILYSMKIGK
jgi:hypothetical protein